MQTILFFDLDATLVENGFSRKVIMPLLQEIADQAEESLDTIRRAFGGENWHRQQHTPDDVHTMDWNHILESIATQYGATVSDTIDNRWQHLANADDIEILDTSPVVLKLLQRPHRKIVLSTKGLYKYQKPVLDLTGLFPLFDDILTPDITGYLKTTPDYFASYADVEALKIQIGDHYYDDVICANQKGYKSVMRVPIDALSVYDPFERPQFLADYKDEIYTYPKTEPSIVPDAVVTSLTELPDVINRLETQFSQD